MVKGSIAGAVIALFACLVPIAASAATPLTFKNAQLGMTLAEWRSLAPPGGAGPDAVAACADDPRIVTLAHNPLSGTLRASDAVGCGYVDLFGDTALPHSILLDARFRANNLRYCFVRGRLAQIQFTASIDAYNNVTAMLEHQYGPPNLTKREQARGPDGRFSRVVETWRSPLGQIVLTDPSDQQTELRVSLSAANETTAQIHLTGR